MSARGAMTLRFLRPGLLGVLPAAVLAVLVLPVPAWALLAGVGAALPFGALGAWILAGAMVRAWGPDDAVLAGMDLQKAGLMDFAIKILGVGVVVGSGFLLDLKFVELASLGLAFAAVAVWIQVAGSLALARILTGSAPARNDAQEDRGGSAGDATSDRPPSSSPPSPRP